MKIVICDDSTIDLENVKNNLVEYLKENEIDYTIDMYDDCRKLLNKIKLSDADTYDLFILDVMMQRNGIDIAKEIRKFSTKSDIIFQTTSEEYAIDAFSVQAFDYILKPVTPERVKKCFDKYFELKKDKGVKHVFTIKTMSHAQQTVDIKSITYIESSDRRMIIHTMKGEDIVTTSLRTKFLESIPFDYTKYIGKNKLKQAVKYETPFFLPSGIINKASGKYTTIENTSKFLFLTSKYPNINPSMTIVAINNGTMNNADLLALYLNPSPIIK